VPHTVPFRQTQRNNLPCLMTAAFSQSSIVRLTQSGIGTVLMCPPFRLDRRWPNDPRDAVNGPRSVRSILLDAAHSQAKWPRWRDPSFLLACRSWGVARACGPHRQSTNSPILSARRQTLPARQTGDDWLSRCSSKTNITLHSLNDCLALQPLLVQGLGRAKAMNASPTGLSQVCPPP
jgi:hypothetical protein